MKREVKFFVTGEGKVCVEDLSPLEAMVLQQMGVKVKEYGDPIAPATPKRSLLRRVRVRGSLPDDVRSLESLHQDVVTNPEKYTDGDTTEGLSVFELKDYIMKKYLAKCLLCGLLCGGSFARKGRCPMTRPARYHHHFVHLGEEAEIGRTLVIELTGCNMRCKFCQKGELIRTARGRLLGKRLWNGIAREYDPADYCNISFLGGNPDQSIVGVLEFLNSGPEWSYNIPIVWHTNGYSTPSLYNLLRGLVDVWVVDFKYFDDRCSVSCSEAPRYVECAKQALETICELSPDVPVIVRHLILPGHWECCQKPLIEWLEGLKNQTLVHLMDQYRPAWKAAASVDLDRTITSSEKGRVEKLAASRGLCITRSRCG